MNNSIKMGDTVRIKSGGPLMTVGKITTAEDAKNEDADDIEGACTCAWFVVNGHSNEHPLWSDARCGVFHVDMLVKDEPPQR